MSRFKSELTTHLNGMMDSLDEDVSHEAIYEQLREALELAMEQDEWPAFCPYDCDSCHDESCPCDRLGCEGNPL